MDEVQHRPREQLVGRVPERALPGRVHALEVAVEPERAEEIAGERVQPARGLLEPALLGQVEHLRERAQQPAVVGLDPRFHHAGPDRLPVRVHEAQPDPAGGEVSGQALLVAGPRQVAVARVHQVEEAQLEKLRLRAAHELAEGHVRLEQPSVGREQRHPGHRRGEHAAQLRGTLLQRRVGVLRVPQPAVRRCQWL